MAAGMLLPVGVALGLVAVGVVVFVMWVGHDRTERHWLAAARDLRTRTEEMASKYLASRAKGALVIGVVQNGKANWLGFGQVSATQTNPPDAETLFEIGSVTKVFTGILLAQMVQAGKVQLSDPITKYLPAEVKLPEELRPITLAQLATHTSGLPRLPDNLDLSPARAANPYAPYTRRELYAYLTTAKLTHPPGEKSVYSNLGVGLLGHLLALRAGRPYAELVRDGILDPLGLTNTTITLTAAQRERLSPGHDAAGNVVANWDFAVLAPAGALRSCVADLLRFVQANLAANNRAELGPALALARKTQYASPTGNVGLCWQIREVRSGYRLCWHNGGTGGYVSFLGLDREHQTGVVLLSNYGDAMTGDNSLDKMGMELLKLAAKVSWE